MVDGRPPLFAAKHDFLERLSHEDLLASSVRIGLAVAGPVGAIIGEFITQIIPEQRLDRLHNVVQLLDDRLDAVEAERLEERIKSSPAFTSLVEEVAFAAVRTPSDQRRRDLAEIIRTGLSKTDADLIAHHALLKLVENLNEAQILMLMSKASFKQYLGNEEIGAFYKKHASVFMDSYGASEPERRQYAINDYYVGDLIARDLLKDTEGIARSAGPRIHATRITLLGAMLLEAIGRPVVEPV